MFSGTILFALAAANMGAAQTSAPRIDHVRAVASASVTVIAAETVTFETAPSSKMERRLQKAVRRHETGRVLIEFY